MDLISKHRRTYRVKWISIIPLMLYKRKTCRNNNTKSSPFSRINQHLCRKIYIFFILMKTPAEFICLSMHLFASHFMHFVAADFPNVLWIAFPTAMVTYRPRGLRFYVQSQELIQIWYRIWLYRGHAFHLSLQRKLKPDLLKDPLYH